MQQKVAIILVNWNGFAYTSNCIASLRNLTYRAFDIIVVDNASPDGSGRQLKEAHQDIILLQSATNTGFSGGNNIGIRYSLAHQYTHTLLLNNDTLAEPGFLSALMNYLNSHPGTGAVQPLIYFNHNRSLVWNGGSYFNKIWGYTSVPGHNKPVQAVHLQTKQVHWITGCALLIRNTVLQQTGLLAGNMFMYSEDVDFSFRIRKLGYQLAYVPNAVIYHIAGMSNKKEKKDAEGFINASVHYYNQRNRIWILKKYVPLPFAPTALLFNFFYITGVMSYFVARFRFAKLRATCRAVKDGLLYGIKYTND
ncbi:glycosyltransferase family 2 protein [Deminuibacter soli]|uniref:Glycosyltransferase family 2 protein n=1 Tax=Deminuibacter soli TaxID=2291815 RepID=A0A3E1NFQ8_9BACT|nr:glycosyltransferase family 2 protein [Deminuibacter soli]RFM26644.1 glycosyltransferase family 2 protein [Deminuibacter soli]